MDGTVMVPVVPGPDPIIPAGTGCALCAGDGPLSMVVVGHRDTAVCVDTLGCVERAIGVRS